MYSLMSIHICVCSVVSDSLNLWTLAHQVPPSMEFSRQGYWSGLPFSSPGDFPDPGIEPETPALQADSLLTELPGKPWELTVRGQNFLKGGRCL